MRGQLDRFFNHLWLQHKDLQPWFMVHGIEHARFMTFPETRHMGTGAEEA